MDQLKGLPDENQGDLLFPEKTLPAFASVPPGSSQARFSGEWAEGEVLMTLTTPSGETIGRNSISEGIEHLGSRDSERYVIDDPEPGCWEIEFLGGPTIPTNGINVTLKTSTLGPGQRQRP